MENLPVTETLENVADELGGDVEMVVQATRWWTDGSGLTAIRGGGAYRHFL